jgi:hypothetical protein
VQRGPGPGPAPGREIGVQRGADVVRVAALCVPSALAQEGGYSLGAQAGEAAIARLAADAGLNRFRRAAEAPFNIVYEARP